MWFGRKRRLLEIRRTWGESIARERRLDTIAASHAERCAALGTRALDDRTWADLDLDDVFVALDRTTSTLGQHALYHRLRTAPVGRPPRRVRDAGRTHARRRRRPRARAAGALPVAGSARLRRLVARRGGRARAAALVQPLPGSDGGNRDARRGGAVLVHRGGRAGGHGGGQHGRSICDRRTDHRDCPQLPAAGPADRDGRIAAVPRRFSTSVHHRSSSQRCSVAGKAEADLTMGQRQPVHVVVQLERARARARRPRRDRLRVPEHCFPAGCDRRSRRPEGSGRAPARAAARCGGDRRSRRRHQRCVVSGGRPYVDTAAVRRAGLLRRRSITSSTHCSRTPCRTPSPCSRAGACW